MLALIAKVVLFEMRDDHNMTPTSYTDASLIRTRLRFGRLYRPLPPLLPPVSSVVRIEPLWDATCSPHRGNVQLNRGGGVMECKRML